MANLNVASVLQAWEEARAQPPVRRALTLLASAWPERSGEEWSSATIGERDALLLSLHEQLFGPGFEGVADCPRCGEALEIRFRSDDIRAGPREPREEFRVSSKEFEVRFRLPNSADLLHIMQADAGDEREALLARCVRGARQGGAAVSLARVPEPVLQAVTEAMSRADPQADVNIAMSCPSCGHPFRMPVDILGYLWSELEDWAQRALYEVHVLASAYGWREQDILGMSGQRRRIYLEMAGA